MSLRTGLVVSSAIAIALGIALLSFLLVRTTRDTLIDQLDQNVVTAADKKSNYPVLGPFGRPNTSQNNNSQNDDSETTFDQFATLVFDGDGNLVDSTPSGYSDNPDPLPNLTSIDRSGKQSRDRFNNVTTISSVDNSMDYRVYICDGKDGAIIAMAAPLTGVNQVVDRMVRYTLVAGAIAILLTATGVWFLIRNQLRPVDQMIDTAAAIAAGDLSQRAPDANPKTELGRLSHALNDMLGQIEESVDVRVENEHRLRRFVADAAHELRTPLTSLRGFAELHRAGALDDPQQLANAMRRIETESSRMQRLVDDLLMLARLDEQRGVTRLPVDLVPLLEDSVEAARVIEPDRPISVNLGTDAMVLGDAGHFRQIFDNLITNARIHTPAGTPISATVRTTAKEVVVTIADRGPGIPEADQERIFERFWRADPSRTRSTGGSGLGLAIVASLVRAHEGVIELESEPGAGAAFTIRFPKQEPEQTPPQAMAPERAADQSRARRRIGDVSPLPSPPNAGD